MKKQQSGVMAVVLALGVVLLAGGQAVAQTVINIHTNLASVTNTTATITSGVDGTRVLPGEAASVWVKFNATATGTNAVWGLDLSFDNVNWTTAQPLRMTNACNGTNFVIARFQFSGTDWGGARYVRLGSVSTVTNTVNTIWMRYVPLR